MNKDTKKNESLSKEKDNIKESSPLSEEEETFGIDMIPFSRPIPEEE